MSRLTMIDKRIDDIDDIKNCYTDIKVAELYKGKKGYFSKSMYGFHDLDSCEYGELVEVKENTNQPFVHELYTAYDFFIPENAVVQKEKKYRPYTLTEFQDKFTIGRPIKFRKKGDVDRERYLTLVGYENGKPNGQTVTWIYIGLVGYTLDELFNKYEWQEHYTEDFEPFGVEE